MNRLHLAVALLLLRAPLGRSQATTTVPPNDPVYGFIDRLVSTRLVSVTMSHRPASRREIGRILQIAERNLDGDAANRRTAEPKIAKTLAEYRRVYPTNAGDSLLSVQQKVYGVEILMADSPDRGIPTTATGAVDAGVNPLLANRLGVQYADGMTAGIVSGAAVPLTRSLVVAGRGRVNEFRGRGTTSSSDLYVEQLYAHAIFRNVGVTAGRDFVFLGQGLTAGLLNSQNPPAFDQIRLASDRPFVLPSLLRLAGPVTGTIYVADLGADQKFPHTRLLEYKLTARPFDAFEIGANVADEIGGDGAPGGTLLQKIEDAFPLLDATVLHRRTYFSNKLVGVDMRLRVPKTRGIQAYMEAAYEDADFRRFKSTFTEDAAYVWGASFSCFRDCASATLTTEYHVTGVRQYTHGPFTSGFSVHGRLIGDQLGPRAKGMYMTLDLDGDGHRFTFAAAHEIRSGDRYVALTTTTDDSDFHFFLYEHHPAERRWRSVVTAALGHPTAHVSAQLSAGVERVEHFDFQPGNWRTNGLLQLGFEVRPEFRGAR